MIGDAARALLGPGLVADTGAVGTYGWAEHVLGAPGFRIAGGSDEIQRTIIGERVLGLPPEPRPTLVSTAVGSTAKEHL
jgi:alkylation response protein AidB-like acyl-CoA dehydrogenase